MESKYTKMRMKAREDFETTMMIIDVKEKQDKKTIVELEEFLTQVHNRVKDSYEKEANKPDEEFNSVKVDCLVEELSMFNRFLKLVTEIKEDILKE